jgi:hypothetical protein
MLYFGVISVTYERSMLRRIKPKIQHMLREWGGCVDGFVTPVSQMFKSGASPSVYTILYTIQSACESAKLAPLRTANTKRISPLPLFDNL